MARWLKVALIVLALPFLFLWYVLAGGDEEDGADYYDNREFGDDDPPGALV